MVCAQIQSGQIGPGHFQTSIRRDPVQDIGPGELGHLHLLFTVPTAWVRRLVSARRQLPPSPGYRSVTQVRTASSIFAEPAHAFDLDASRATMRAVAADAVAAPVVPGRIVRFRGQPRAPPDRGQVIENAGTAASCDACREASLI